MKVTAQLKRQAAVGAVAQQAVPEGQGPGVVAGDKLCDLVPGWVLRFREIVDDVRQQIDRERLPEDRHPTQEAAGLDRESIDTGGGNLLNGFRKALNGISAPRSCDQLPKEKRIAA